MGIIGHECSVLSNVGDNNLYIFQCRGQAEHASLTQQNAETDAKAAIV
jgi:hypothetical protein